MANNKPLKRAKLLGEVHEVLIECNETKAKVLAKKNTKLDERIMISFINKIKNWQKTKPNTRLALLYFAIMNDQLEICKYLIEDGAVLHYPDANSGFLQPVEFALKSKKFRIVRLLEAHGGDLYFKDVKEKDPKLFKILKHHGIKVKNHLMSPLLVAIREGNLEAVKALTEAGANVQEGHMENHKIVPLILAVQLYELEIVKHLLKKGAKVDAVCRISGNTALLEAANNHIWLPEEKEKGILVKKIVKVLLDHDADINVVGNVGVPPMEVATMVDNYDIVELLMKAGAQTKHLKGVLLPAVKNGDSQAIQTCFEFGEDYNCTDFGPNYPYHHALRTQNPKSLNIFWKYGCPFDQCLKGIPKSLFDIFHSTKMSEINKAHLKNQQRFIEAISKNDPQSVLEALDNGAEVRGCSVDIKSPLHLVSERGDFEIVQTLLEKGVPANTVIDGKTPIYLATCKQHENICQKLLQHGACFSVKTNGRSLYEISQKRSLKKLFKTVSKTFAAVKLGRVEILQVLKSKVEQDPELFLVLVNAVDRRGLTLMGSALRRGHTEIAEGIMRSRLQLQF